MVSKRRSLVEDESPSREKAGGRNLLVALPFFFCACLLFIVLRSIEYGRVHEFRQWSLVALVWFLFLLSAGAVGARFGYTTSGDPRWRRWARMLEVLSILLVFPICLMLVASRGN